jgi:hypothetical protein
MHFGHLVVKMLGKSGKARVKVVETWREKCSMPEWRSSTVKQ